MKWAYTRRCQRTYVDINIFHTACTDLLSKPTPHILETPCTAYMQLDVIPVYTKVTGVVRSGSLTFIMNSLNARVGENNMVAHPLAPLKSE